MRTGRWKNRRDGQTDTSRIRFSNFSNAAHDGNLVEHFYLLYTGQGFVTQTFVFFKKFLTFLTQRDRFMQIIYICS